MKLIELMTMPKEAQDRIQQEVNAFLAGEKGVPHAMLVITVHIDEANMEVHAHTEVSANGVGEIAILEALDRYTKALEKG